MKGDNVLFPTTGLRELHLFCGAGGGVLGGMLLGHTCVCAVEIEPYCRKVLLQRQRDGILPRFPIWDDVRTFRASDWRGLVDIVCGGFPCQPFSAAGNRKGSSDTRDLTKETLRCIQEIQPKFVFLENVQGLLSIQSPTCVCGWPYRRRGLRQDSEERVKDLGAGGADHDVEQGVGTVGEHEIGVWWRSLFAELQPQGMVPANDVAYHWGVGGYFSKEGSAFSGAQGRTVSISDCIARIKGTGGLDRLNEAACSAIKAELARIKPTWACGDCGRMVSPNAEFIRYVGAILGTLSEMGFSCRWGVVSAADAGAPHLRERIWILGYERGGSIREFRTPLATDGNKQGHGNLAHQVKLWPTPNVPNGGRRVPSDATIRGGQTCKQQWPTPTADDASNVTRQSGQYQSLTRKVKQHDA